jgi:vancomycin resistance protein YoaR
MIGGGRMSARVPGCFVLILAILLVTSVAAFEAVHANRIYPGISVWGTRVGGMMPERAAAKLENNSRLDEPLITLSGPDRSWNVRPSNLGLELKSAPTLERAYRTGREDSWVTRLVSQLELLAFGADVAPIITYDESEARRYLEALSEQVDVPPVDAQLTLDGTTPVVEPAQPGRRLNVDLTLAVLSSVVTELAPKTIPLAVEEVPPKIQEAESARIEIQRLLDGPLTLTVNDPREGNPGPWVIPPEELVAMVKVEREADSLHASIDEQAFRTYLEKLAPALEIEPVDARFHFNEATGKLEPITESRVGQTLDAEATVNRVVQALEAGQREVALVTKEVPPSYPDTATAEELGIVDLVATGESYFIGSPSGRDHNIRLAASQFDGLVIPPGETFSFNHHLGEVTAEAGYDESYITAGEQLAIGIGGGICQVSTTAFRAAFWGGYPITERWAHSQRVAYYELRGGDVGMDATIYSPNVDLRFINDRSAPLLIETEVEQGTHRLFFRFYSTDDGREVEMIGPEITNQTAPGPPIYELDEDLAPGSVTKWQSAVDGLTATIDRRVRNASGELKYEDTFVSKFEPRRAAYHYGPGYEPPTQTGD